MKLQKGNFIFTIDDCGIVNYIDGEVVEWVAYY